QGGRYGYRLGVVESGVEYFHTETWVDVPRNALALSAVGPNPAANDLWVSFSLAGNTPATLSLIDIAGREVRLRQVGGLGPGPQRVNLGEGGRLPMGVYVVRLAQAGHILTRRVSVVR